MSIDTIPNLTREKSGKLSADSDAVAALRAIAVCSCPRGESDAQDHRPGCPALADFVTRLEAQYEVFMYEREGVSTWRGKLAWFFAEIPLAIFRREIAKLARAYQQEVSSHKANVVQADIQAEFYRLHEQHRKLREFIEQNFPNEMRRCVAEERPWFPDLVRELLLKGKG